MTPSWPDSVSGLGIAVLLAFVGIVAAAPDEAVLRQKLFWSRIAAAAAFLMALLSCHGKRTIVYRSMSFILMTCALALYCLLHYSYFNSIISYYLFVHEVLRLAAIPAVAWAASYLADSSTRRGTLVAVLALGVLGVSAYALAQHLSGVLGLPLARMPRAAATFGNPLFLAAFLVASLPVCASVALAGTRRLRWLAACATGLGLPALLATGSRAAWVAAAAAALVATLLATGSSARRWIGIAAVLALGAVVLILYPDVVARPQAHTLIWRDTLRLIAENPWGVGAGQFLARFPAYASPELLAFYPSDQFIVNDAHSEAMQLLAELGWPGLLLAAGALLALSRAVLRAIRNAALPVQERPILVGVASGLAGVAVQSLGSPDLRFQVSTLYASMLAGLALSFSPARERTIPGGRWGSFGFAGAILVAATLITQSALEQFRWHSDLHLSVAANDVRPDASVIENSIPELRSEVALNPGSAIAHYRLGVGLAALSRFQEAIAHLERAALLAPGDLSTLRALAFAAALGQDFAAARVHASSVLDRAPADTETRYLLAYSSWALGDLPRAITELERVLRDQPDHDRARMLHLRLTE